MIGVALWRMVVYTYVMSTTSKSPRKVLLAAYAVAQEALPTYASRYSRKDFTQPQLFACLVLKEFLNTDYRGVEATLQDCEDLRQGIGLDKTPHFTTLHKAHDRLLRAPSAKRLLDQTVAMGVQAKIVRPTVALAAIDASGFETHHISRYFVRRCEKGGRISGKTQTTTYRRFPKAAIVCDCQSHMILAVHTERGPSPDILHLERAMVQALWRVRISTVLADAGYDAESSHELLRYDLNVRSLIPATIGRPTNKSPSGYFRRWMRQRLHRTRYGQRWQSETVFSMIKRRLGSTLGAQTYWRQNRAMTLKTIAHNILILLWIMRVSTEQV